LAVYAVSVSLALSFLIIVQGIYLILDYHCDEVESQFQSPAAGNSANRNSSLAASGASDQKDDQQ
jgi:hypothetical protein